MAPSLGARAVHSLTVLFSVAIPCFNRHPFLLQALASVWSQTFSDYELIVIDDGSTDGTQEYLSSVTRPIHLIRQANLGPGAARNAGMAAARGEYVAFLDSDDLWFPWTLAVMAQVIRENDAPAIVGARVKQFRDEAETVGILEEPLQVLRYNDFLASAASPVLIGSGTVAVRRDVAMASGGFTTCRINGEDHDLILRLGTAPGFVLITAPITLGWRRHAGGATHSVEKSIQGANYLVDQERAGRYPGGRERARERLDFITRHARPVSFACLRSNEVRAGLHLYGAMLLWHMRLGRWAYLLAFPFSALRWAAARATAGRRLS